MVKENHLLEFVPSDDLPATPMDGGIGKFRRSNG